MFALPGWSVVHQSATYATTRRLRSRSTSSAAGWDSGGLDPGRPSVRRAPPADFAASSASPCAERKRQFLEVPPVEEPHGMQTPCKQPALTLESVEERG